MLTLFLQIGQHFTAGEAGLGNLPLAVGTAIGGAVSGAFLADRIGRKVLQIGPLVQLVGAAVLWFELDGVDASSFLIRDIAPGVAVSGIGAGMVIAALFSFILAAVDDEIGFASGALSAVQAVGGSIGVAVFGSVFFAQAKTGEFTGGVHRALVVQAYLLVVFLAITFLLPKRAAPKRAAPKKSSAAHPRWLPTAPAPSSTSPCEPRPHGPGRSALHHVRRGHILDHVAEFGLGSGQVLDTCGDAVAFDGELFEHGGGRDTGAHARQEFDDGTAGEAYREEVLDELDPLQGLVGIVTLATGRPRRFQETLFLVVAKGPHADPRPPGKLSDAHDAGRSLLARTSRKRQV